jgi:uncharacterized protein with HEPN domain
MSIRTDSEFLLDILNSIDRIEEYCNGMTYNDFQKDLKTQDAVVRNIEVIGEAVGRLSEETKNQLVNVPWSKIKSTRNRLIHNYFGINLDILWSIIKEDLPELYLNITKHLT